MKTNTEKRTTNQNSRKCLEHFLPDMLHQGFEELPKLTLADCLTLGRANLEKVRQHHRGQEVKLVLEKSRIEAANLMLDTVDVSDGTSNFISLEEIAAHSAEELETWRAASGKHQVMCSWKSCGKGCLACRYGHSIAAWCKMTPCDAPVNTGSLPISQRIPRELLEQEYPFIDKPCLLTNTEQVESAKAFLQTKYGEVVARIKLVRQRIDCLTKVIKIADERPILPIWRNPDTWAKSGDHIIVPLEDGTKMEGIVLDAHYRLSNAPGEFLLVSFTETVMVFRPNNPIICLLWESEYLQNHKEYLDFWTEANDKLDCRTLLWRQM